MARQKKRAQVLSLPNEILSHCLRLSFEPSDLLARQSNKHCLQLVCKRFYELASAFEKALLCVRYAAQCDRLIARVKTAPEGFLSVTKLHLELLDPQSVRMVSHNLSGHLRTSAQIERVVGYLSSTEPGAPLKEQVRTVEEARTEVQRHAEIFAGLLPLFPKLERLSLCTVAGGFGRAYDLVSDIDYEMASYGGDDPATMPLDAFLLAFAKLPCLSQITHLRLSAPSTDSANAYLIEAASWHSVCTVCDAMPNLENIIYRVPALVYSRMPPTPTVIYHKLKEVETSLTDLVPLILFAKGYPNQPIDVNIVLWGRLGKAKTDAKLLQGAKSVKAGPLILNQWPRPGSEESWEIEGGGTTSIKASCCEILELPYAQRYFERLTKLTDLDLGMLHQPAPSIMQEAEEFLEDREEETAQNVVALVAGGSFPSLERLTVGYCGALSTFAELEEACDKRGIELIDTNRGQGLY